MIFSSIPFPLWSLYVSSVCFSIYLWHFVTNINWIQLNLNLQVYQNLLPFCPYHSARIPCILSTPFCPIAYHCVRPYTILFAIQVFGHRIYHYNYYAPYTRHSRSSRYPQAPIHDRLTQSIPIFFSCVPLCCILPNQCNRELLLKLKLDIGYNWVVRVYYVRTATKHIQWLPPSALVLMHGPLYGRPTCTCVLTNCLWGMERPEQSPMRDAI